MLFLFDSVIKTVQKWIGKVRVASYELRVTSCELLVAPVLRVASCELVVKSASWYI